MPVIHVSFFLLTPAQYTDPPSALGCWIALEKCTASNGALSFLPGSHKTTPITKRFVRLGPGKGTGFEALVSPEEEQAVQERSKAEQDKYIMETCEPGEYESLALIQERLMTCGCRGHGSHPWIGLAQVRTEYESKYEVCVYVPHD